MCVGWQINLMADYLVSFSYYIVHCVMATQRRYWIKFHTAALWSNSDITIAVQVIGDSFKPAGSTARLWLKKKGRENL